jgi:hypothetical protein
MSEAFTNDAMDSTAQLIAYQVPVETIRASLLSRGLSLYNAYLCYKAAQLLLATGFYDHSSRVVAVVDAMADTARGPELKT